MNNEELLSEGITPGTITVKVLCSQKSDKTIRILQHFDISETWSFEGNAGLSNASKLGTGCAEFRDITGKAICTNTTGVYNLEAEGAYEAEFFVKADLSALQLKVEELHQELSSEGYRFYDGHTFKYFNTAATWKNAKTACESLGGHLATSTDASKNAFLSELAGGKEVWLGGTDEETEGVWKWVTGEAWSYTNWDTGQPDNSGKQQHYLTINFRSKKGYWDDNGAGAIFGYLCEWDYDMREQAARSGNLLRFGDELTLGIMSDGRITLQSSAWGIDATSETRISSAEWHHMDTWHHVLLRILDGEASVYLGGELALSGKISGLPITPDKLTLGGYKGYLDEFVFRHGASTGTPTVPTRAYEISCTSDHEELDNLLGGNEEGHYHLTREQIEWIDRRMNDELRPKIKPGQTIKVTLGEELSDYQVKSCKTGSKNTNTGGSSNGN